VNASIVGNYSPNLRPVLLFCSGSHKASNCNWAARQTAGDGVEQTCQLSTSGVERTVGLRVPASFDTAATKIFMIYLHGGGGGGTITDCDKVANLFSIVDSKGVALACPLGLTDDLRGRVWNVYYCYINTGAAPCWSGPPPDDSGFVRAIIQAAEANLNINPKDVFVTGFSAGSQMLSRVITDDAGLVSAVAVVAGAKAVWDQNSGPAYAKNGPFPPAKNPVSVMVRRGDQDTGTPVCSQPDHSITTLDEDLAHHSQQFSCTVQTPNPNPFCPSGRGGPPSAETYKKWSGCKNGVEVRAYVIQGAAHHLYTMVEKPDITSSPPPYNGQLGVDFQPGWEEQIVWQWFANHVIP